MHKYPRLPFSPSTALAFAALVLAILFTMPHDALAVSLTSSGGFNNDPFEKGKSWFTEMGKGVSILITAAAFLAGMVVILFAMFNIIKKEWAARIIGGLLAMTALSWIIESIASGL